MSEKKFFGPKREKIEEIIVYAPEDTISFPKLQENSEAHSHFSINENEKSLMKIQNNQMKVEKTYISSQINKRNFFKSVFRYFFFFLQ